MAVKVLIVEDNPVARSFLTRVVKESFSDALVITEAGDLETARRQIGPLREGAQNARRCRRDGRLRHTALDCNELP